MPAKSKAQLRWINSPSGRKALGAAGVQEWDQASKGLNLAFEKIVRHCVRLQGGNDGYAVR